MPLKYQAKNPSNNHLKTTTVLHEKTSSQPLVCFWGNVSPYSNFSPIPLVMDNILFACSEQAFMYLKAMHFKDASTAHKILHETRPYECKKLGRLVQGFFDEEWSIHREACMLKVLRAKLASNPSLLTELQRINLEHPNAMFVEASPTDKIWGVGMDVTHPTITDSSTWRGSNLLGKLWTILLDEYRPKSVAPEM